jgi:hypothetical protein
VKDQRLVVEHKVLVERKSTGAFYDDRRIDPVDSIRDLMDVRSGLAIGDGHLRSPWRENSYD